MPLLSHALYPKLSGLRSCYTLAKRQLQQLRPPVLMAVRAVEA